VLLFCLIFAYLCVAGLVAAAVLPARGHSLEFGDFLMAGVGGMFWPVFAAAALTIGPFALFGYLAYKAFR
jgi:hypothetical protein